MLQIVSNPMLPGTAKQPSQFDGENQSIGTLTRLESMMRYDEWVALQWSEMDWFS